MLLKCSCYTRWLNQSFVIASKGTFISTNFDIIYRWPCRSYMALCVNFITWKSRLSRTGSQEILGISLDFTYLPQTKLKIARCKRSSFFKCFEFNGAYTKSLKSIFDTNKLSASCFRNLKLVKFFSFFNTASLPYVDATVSLTCLCHTISVHQN